jgi:hypothetical protein
MRFRPLTLATSASIAFALVVAITTSAGAGTDSDAKHAAQLVRETRHAAAAHDFTGEATVTWTTASGVHRANVHVVNADGTTAITAADGGEVFDEGRRTYLRDHLGWTGLVVEPTAHSTPPPNHRWTLSTAGAATVAGRPATVVLASRPNGEPAQRLVVDDATGVLLARDVLGPRGGRQRSVRFTTIDLGETAITRVSSPTAARERTAKPLASVPDGYRAPDAPAGFELVTRSRHPDGVLLFYSDGVFTASVFEQQGDVDWGALPPGGSDSQLADTRTRMYQDPSGDVAVWEHDGLVFTCVTDAPSDVFAHMVGALASDKRSTTEQVVDFVLGPFGWG